MLVQLPKMFLTDTVTGETRGWFTADRSESYNTRRQVRFYTGGRKRAIGPRGMAGAWKFTLMELTLTDVADLKVWLTSGALVFARDHRGRALYGTFFAIDVAENRPDFTYRATITLLGQHVADGGLDVYDVTPIVLPPPIPTGIAGAADNQHTAFNATTSGGSIGVPDVTAPANAHTAFNPTVTATASTVVELGTTAFASANAATVTTASFTPTANSLVVAYCAQGNGSGGAASLGTVSSSIGGTTGWVRLTGLGDNWGVAEIWAKDAGASPSASTVTYDPGGTGTSGTTCIVAWYGGALPVASQPGGSGNNGSGSTAFTISITAAAIGSFIVGAVGRASSPITYTAAAGTTILGQFSGSAGDTACAFRRSVVTTATGATSIGFSATTLEQNMAAAEIKPA